MNPLTKGYILFHTKPISIIQSYRQSGNDESESGGILLGYKRGPHLEVTDVTTPGNQDIGSRTSFYRCDNYHSDYALSCWTTSGNTLSYVGEWHTHPEKHPQPSILDINEWKRASTSANNGLICMIQGTSSMWLGVANNSSISKCPSISYKLTLN